MYLFYFLSLAGLCCCSFYSRSPGATLQVQCASFWLQRLLLLGSTGCRGRLQESRPTASPAGEHRLQEPASVVTARGRSGFSSGGTWAQMLCGRWDPLRPRSELVSPTLQGGLLTAGPPRKPPFCFLPFKSFLNFPEELYKKRFS